MSLLWNISHVHVGSRPCNRVACALRSWIIAALLTPVMVGCSNRPSRVEAPAVDPSAVAKSMVEEYDTNGDRSLSPQELNACPALATSLKAYDKNADGAISESEISDRITQIYQNRVAYYRLYAKVTMDGRPLPGARVKLVPEAAFADSLNEATGNTDQMGAAPIKVAEADMPSDLHGIFWGVQTGLYRIQVEHDSKTLPEDVISGDRLGAEITSANSQSGIHVAITTK